MGMIVFVAEIIIMCVNKPLSGDLYRIGSTQSDSKSFCDYVRRKPNVADYVGPRPGWTIGGQ